MLQKVYWIVILCLFFSHLQAEDEVIPLEEVEAPAAPYCYFHPPKDWLIADLNSLGKQVKMAFIKKIKGEGFSPSLNLAEEIVDGTLNEYLNDVKAIYEQDRTNHWRKLGRVHTCAGEAQLTEIDTHSHHGPVRMLQLILHKEGRVYILTAAALKRDFCNYYRDFQDAFRSLTLTFDPFETVPQIDRRLSIKQDLKLLIEAWNTISVEQPSEEKFASEDFQKEQWMPFEKKILDGFEDMGQFWQVLALVHVRQILLSHRQ